MANRRINLAVQENKLPEIFDSIQGEGPHVGRPSVFVRLSGCNLYCVWCDTAYTWNWKETPYPHQRDSKFVRVDEQERLDVESCSRILNKSSLRHLVVTGGEPMIQQSDLVVLLKALVSSEPKWSIDIESNGTIIPCESLAGMIESFVISPKLSNSGVPKKLRVRGRALSWFSKNERSYFKFVVDSRSDLAEADELIDDFAIRKERVYLMPAADSLEQLRAAQTRVADWCIERGYRFSDRLHIRLFGAKRGV